MAAVLAAVGSQLSQSSLQATPAPLPYAYITDAELVAMQGARVVGRAPVQYDVSHGDLVTTTDGQFFAVLSGPALTGADEQDLQLVVINATTGQVQIRDCPACESIAPIGGSQLMVDVSDGFLRFDLSISNPPLRFKPEQKPSEGFHLLSGTEGVVLAAARNPDNPGTEDFYVVRADGTSRKIATEDRPEAHAIGQQYHQKYGLGRSAASTLPTGEVRFAVSSAAIRRDLSCAMDGNVSVFSSDGQVEDAGLESTNHAQIRSGIDGALTAQDLWWDNAGELHAIIVNDTCGVDNVGETRTSIGEWRFRDRRWLQVSNDQTRAVRQLDGRSRVLLRPQAIGAWPELGYDLYLDEGGSEREIAQAAALLTTKGAFPIPLGDPCRINPANCPARPPGVLQRLYTAPVPSLCEHPAGTLADGSLPGLASNQGYVTLLAKDSENVSDMLAIGDVTGDGVDDTAAVFLCSQGGVNWPENIVLYSSSMHILGSFDLGDVSPTDEHADIERMKIHDGNVLLTWTSYQGAGFCLKKWSGKLHWDGRSLTMQNLAQAKNIPFPTSDSSVYPSCV